MKNHELRRLNFSSTPKAIVRPATGWLAVARWCFLALGLSLASLAGAAKTSLPNFDRRLDRAKLTAPGADVARENATTLVQSRVRQVKMNRDEILGFNSEATDQTGGF